MRTTPPPSHPASECPQCSRESTVLYPRLKDRFFGVPGEWTVRRCATCRTTWIDPRPDPASVPQLYADYFTHTNRSDRIPSGPQSAWVSFKALILDAVLAAGMGYPGVASSGHIRLLGKVLLALGPVRELVELSVLTITGPARGRLLDVGSGDGGFLAKMQRLGWDVTGVEPDAKAARSARERHGVPVTVGELEEARLPAAEFDVVTMSHVLEHLRDPTCVLAECLRILKPGGRLVIVTPNLASLGHRFFREAWPHLDPPRHFFLFDRQSLVRLVEATGFRIERVRATARIAYWTWVTGQAIRVKGVMERAEIRYAGPGVRVGGVLFRAVEHMANYFHDAGEELILVAAKG